MIGRSGAAGSPELEIEVLDEGATATAPPAPATDPLRRLATIALAVGVVCLLLITWSFVTMASASRQETCIVKAQAVGNTYFGFGDEADSRRLQAVISDRLRDCGVEPFDATEGDGS